MLATQQDNESTPGSSVKLLSPQSVPILYCCMGLLHTRYKAQTDQTGRRDVWFWALLWVVWVKVPIHSLGLWYKRGGGTLGFWCLYSQLPLSLLPQCLLLFYPLACQCLWYTRTKGWWIEVTIEIQQFTHTGKQKCRSIAEADKSLHLG